MKQSLKTLNCFYNLGKQNQDYMTLGSNELDKLAIEEAAKKFENLRAYNKGLAYSDGFHLVPLRKELQSSEELQKEHRLGSLRKLVMNPPDINI